MRTPTTALRLGAYLGVALVATSSLLTTPQIARAGDPPPGEAGAERNCPDFDAATGAPIYLWVDALTGPDKLATDASVDYTVTVRNPASPNIPECDAGLHLEIVTLGTVKPGKPSAGGDGVDCTAEPANGISTIFFRNTLPVTGGYRCVAPAFKGGSRITLAVSIQGAALGTGRIDAFARRLNEERPSSALASWRTLEVAVSPAPPGNAGAPMTGELLKSPSYGENVKALQYLLRARGQDVAIDGEFEDQLDSSVKTFQSSNQLPANGVVGPETWSKLSMPLKQGDQGDAVRAAQTLLAWHTVDVSVDGDFGPQTRDAVRIFQADKNVPVTGEIDSRTWAALVNSN
jgi:hypothetical protein